MNPTLFCTLLCDGTSDKRLEPILKWVIQQSAIAFATQFSTHKANTRVSFPLRIEEVLRLYPNTDLLFVHRDAEREPIVARIQEIRDAVESSGTGYPIIPVVPVRMTAAWLLFDEYAIRRAAGNPNGRTSLTLPRISTLESLPTPKEVLASLLTEASGLSAHRRRHVNLSQMAHLVPEFITDFSPLRHLTAFQALEAELLSVLHTQGWA